MVKKGWLAVLFLLIASGMVYAQSEAGFTVEEFKFCTSVDNREPMGINTKFPNTVDRLYCYTKISADSYPKAVAHVWYYNDQLKNKVLMNVKGKSWRLWSSKTIPKDMAGVWRVDLVTENGQVIQSLDFLIESP